MPAVVNRPIALDTSVAVPLLVQTHGAHRRVVEWWRRRPVALSGHALAETYAVLTRLPGDIKLGPVDAARLISERFETPLLLAAADARRIPALLAELDVMGGAVYDALVAFAAATNGCVLATRDSRALGTYQAVGVEIDIVGAGAQHIE